MLLWYFGKPSFSHNDSGKAGLIFDCQTADFDILSDETWKCETNAAYGTCDKPDPNFRLAESNIRYDGRKSDDAWYMPSFDDRDMTRAVDQRTGRMPALEQAGQAPDPAVEDRRAARLRLAETQRRLDHLHAAL